jgi:minor histocompatibility antigen H13
VTFPQDLIENGFYANKFAILGLGDIVVPGIFIALLLRFDYRSVEFRLFVCISSKKEIK